MTKQPSMIFSRIRPAVAVLTALVLSGCATLSQDGGLDAVSALTQERIGQAVTRSTSEAELAATQARVDALLAKPLTAEAAVEIALINNRGLQASLAELGISEAEMVQAGRLRNPGFGFGKMGSGNDVEIERSVVFDLIGLITMPARVDIERRRFEQVQQQAAMAAVALATDTRRAYYTAVAANESVGYLKQVQSAAQAGAELAQEMIRVGNWSKLQQAREQAFYADATAQLARAQHAAVIAREALMRKLGIWDRSAALKLPARLPDLPKAARNADDLERQAITDRLDVQSAKRATQALASRLGLTRVTGVIDGFEVAYKNKSEVAAPRTNGYELGLELPIFDWGQARTAKAEAMYMQSVHRTADVAIRARSEVREAYSAYRTAYDLARHYRDEIVPLRKKISDEMLLRYNSMLAGVFELLADARTQVGSVNTSIEALRDFWLADTNMQMALTGSGGTNTALAGNAAGSDAGAEH